MKEENQNDNDDDQTGADDNQDVCFLLVERSAKNSVDHVIQNVM